MVVVALAAHVESTAHRVQAIYGHGAPFRKSKGYQTMLPMPDGWSTMTSIDKTLHRNLRRVFRSGMAVDVLARHEPAVVRNLEIYFGELLRDRDAQGWSAAADMRIWSESQRQDVSREGCRVG